MFSRHCREEDAGGRTEMPLRPDPLEIISSGFRENGTGQKKPTIATITSCFKPYHIPPTRNSCIMCCLQVWLFREGYKKGGQGGILTCSKQYWIHSVIWPSRWLGTTQIGQTHLSVYGGGVHLFSTKNG